MATQPQEILDDEIDTDIEPVDDEPEVEEEQPGDDDTPPDEGEEEDEISFGGTAVDAGEAEPEGVRNLRAALHREKEARKALEARLAPQSVDLGPEPDVYDYEDQAAWRADWDKWRAKHDEQADQDRKRREAAENAQREYQEVERSFEQQGSALRVRDYGDARDTVMGRFDPEQRAMLLNAAEKPAALVYALSRQPDRLDELLKIENPIKFTAAIARLDMGVTVNARRPTTQPETVHRGAGGSGQGDNAKRLAALEAEADRTGNRDKVQAFKRKLKEQGK